MTDSRTQSVASRGRRRQVSQRSGPSAGSTWRYPHFQRDLADIVMETGGSPLCWGVSRRGGDEGDRHRSKGAVYCGALVSSECSQARTDSGPERLGRTFTATTIGKVDPDVRQASIDVGPVGRARLSYRRAAEIFSTAAPGRTLH